MSNNIYTEEEKHYGIIFNCSYNEAKELGKEKIAKMLDSQDYIPVNIEDRIVFLESNNYEVTRENLVDSSLSVKRGSSEEEQ